MMDFMNWAFYESNINTTLEQDEDNYWKVTYSVRQARKKTEDSELEEKTVSMTAHNKSMERALASVTMSVGEYLSKYDYNLFTIEKVDDADYTN